MITKNHYFFLLNSSPFPILLSMNVFLLFFSFLFFLKFSMTTMFFLNILNMFLSMMFWWTAYSSEFNLSGSNSSTLEKGVKFAMILFISSEVFFFFSFFWSYFQFFLSPCMELGLAWPPVSLVMFDCFNVPMINTMLLLLSGVTITVSHMFLFEGLYKKFMFYLSLTILLGLTFSLFQFIEYKSSFFSVSDSTFGTSFFMLTGFHGIHVLVGVIFLSTTLWRNLKLISGKMDFLSFELSSWYWHFVDVVWIFLYTIIYYMNM